MFIRSFVLILAIAVSIVVSILFVVFLIVHAAFFAAIILVFLFLFLDCCECCIISFFGSLLAATVSRSLPQAFLNEMSVVMVRL